MAPKDPDSFPDTFDMSDSSSTQSTPDIDRRACQVCGSHSVFVTGAELSLCSNHARLSMDHGWVAWTSARRQASSGQGSKPAD
jgi:hypothetical protein